MAPFISFLDRMFHLTESHTSAKTEVMAGLTTFMTMAYILAVHPSVMGAVGMDKGAVLTATALASAFGTVLMALWANYPFVLAPGIGLGAFFSFTVVMQMGYTWEMALAAVFVEGVIFVLLSWTHVREAIFDAIPMTLKKAISVGIGLFVAFIGLNNAHIITANPATKVSLFPFGQIMEAGTFPSVGVPVVLALLGIVITAAFLVKKVKGNILWGILSTWGLGMGAEAMGIYVPSAELGAYSTFPDFSKGLASFLPADPAPIMMHLDFSALYSLDFFVIVFAFLFVDLFDTLGTLVGVCAKANMLDEKGTLPHIKGALMADAVATTAGSCLGISPATTFVESAAGVAEGGRTGLTALTAAGLFLLALFLSPFFIAIPAFATAPALVIVGYLMFTTAADIPFGEALEALPAYVAILAMPFTYSVAEGISLGIIAYTLIHLFTGHTGKISPLMYGLTVIFLAKYILM